MKNVCDLGQQQINSISAKQFLKGVKQYSFILEK